MFIGGYLLRFLGAIIIWVYEIIYRLILGKKVPAFKNVWSITYTGDYSGPVTKELKQKIIGFSFILLVILVDYWWRRL